MVSLIWGSGLRFRCVHGESQLVILQVPYTWTLRAVHYIIHRYLYTYIHIYIYMHPYTREASFMSCKLLFSGMRQHHVPEGPVRGPMWIYPKIYMWYGLGDLLPQWHSNWTLWACQDYSCSPEEDALAGGKMACDVALCPKL